MSLIAIIGGTGLQKLDSFRLEGERVASTPFGDPSAPLQTGNFAGRPVLFLTRHGRGHTLPPHAINYRANIRALADAGVSRIIAVAAVGGITTGMRPGRLVLPSQLIDYTWGRRHTFFDEPGTPVTHIDFTDPYCETTRRVLLDAAAAVGVDAAQDGVYGATQGPRLETPAEIDRMERDGCDIVGMTGMPEAALARELNIPYACCAVVANWAAGRGDGPITMAAIDAILADGMRQVAAVLGAAMPRLAALGNL
jgi:5'-methylthioinosine phosphorylase